MPQVQAIGINNLTTSVGSSDVLPPGCSLTLDSVTKAGSAYFNTNNESSACCGFGVEAVAGQADWSEGNVTLELTIAGNATVSGNSSGDVEISLRGPADGNWFGVGFDTTSMSNAPYAIIVDGANGTVSERVLGNHLPGVELRSSVTVVSNNVEDGFRTVVMTRASDGLSPEYYSFDIHKLSLDVIMAVGDTPELSYHKAKTATQVALWPKTAQRAATPSNAVCLCSVPALPFGQGQGTLEYLPTGETIGFPLRCNPTESVLTNRNPTCDIRTYVGGLSTCHHMWSLLDADQEIPWSDQPITYYLKWRLYFQEYDPSHHVQAFDITWSIAGDTGKTVVTSTKWFIVLPRIVLDVASLVAGEYDVPRCAPGTPTEQCTHEITGP